MYKMRNCMICGIYQLFKLIDFLDFSHPNIQMCFCCSENPVGQLHQMHLVPNQGR